MTKILGVITARGGSKGIPKKNVKLLGGRPLISYTIAAAKKSKFLSELIVSTDDEEIAKVARQWGGEVPFMRPKELAGDTVPHVPVVKHAIEFMERKSESTYDYVVIFQPTSPFRTVSDIDETIKKALENKADSAVSLVEVDSPNPIKFKKLEGNRVLPYFYEEPERSRRQDLPKVYKRSGAVFVSKRDLVMVHDKLFGDYCVGYVVPKIRSIDIDTDEDWVLAEYKYKKLDAEGFFKDYFG